MTIFGFFLILGYLVGMYLLVSPDTTRAALFLPLALRGAGYATLYIVLSLYASRTVPFLHFFHVLAFFGFMSIAGLLVLVMAMVTRYRAVVRFKMPRW